MLQAEMRHFFLVSAIDAEYVLILVGVWAAQACLIC
jgi:hypothetical protein